VASNPAPKDVRPIRCAVYTRKSTATGLEKDFNSLDAQRESCEAYVRSRALEGWTVVEEVFEDGGFTGANIDRPGFRRLMARVKAKAIDVVVVYKVDRLSRSLLDFSQVMADFTKSGVAFVSVTQHFSTADPVGRLTLNMLMSFAEFEREMITERVRDKLAAARAKGKWTGGRPPLGYAAKGGYLEVVEEEAAWVARIFESYLAGTGTPTLAEQLNDAGLPLKGSIAKRLRPWTKTLILRILKNRLYLGEIRCRGEWVQAQHPALVDREVFDRVQRALEPHAHKQRHTSKNPTYLLRGTIRCARCGVPMTSASTHRHGRHFRYYRCTTRNLRGKKACPTKQLPTEAIEIFVVDRLREAMADPVRAAVVGRLLPELGDFVVQGFDALWAALTLVHRQRLVRFLVASVVVDEARGTVRIDLRDPASLEALDEEDGPGEEVAC
jgi:DNA invertase Pin-like site-specific DNA recombinase